MKKNADTRYNKSHDQPCGVGGSAGGAPGSGHNIGLGGSTYGYNGFGRLDRSWARGVRFCSAYAGFDRPWARGIRLCGSWARCVYSTPWKIWLSKNAILWEICKMFRCYLSTFCSYSKSVTVSALPKCRTMYVDISYFSEKENENYYPLFIRLWNIKSSFPRNGVLVTALGMG